MRYLFMTVLFLLPLLLAPLAILGEGEWAVRGHWGLMAVLCITLWMLSSLLTAGRRWSI